jgi:hypothetical protein
MRAVSQNPKSQASYQGIASQAAEKLAIRIRASLEAMPSGQPF